MESSKHITEQWFLLSDLSYTFIGDPEGIDLNNEFTFNVGAGYDFSPSITASLSYQQSTALLDGRPDPKAIVLNLDYKINDASRIFLSANAGLSDGSPDGGFTLGAALRY